MSTRNLDAILKPRSVALIGASARPRSIGNVMARNLLAGGFAGSIRFVNPNSGAIEGVAAMPDVARLPEAPDLAVIATPPKTVPGLVAELGARGTRGVIVITAGFGELDTAEGARLQQATLEAARPHLLRIVGPTCLGVLAPGAGVNASFAHIAPLKGDLAFVSQSGAMLTAVLDWATARGIGFSRMVSLGGMLDVDFGDMLDYLAQDGETRAILLYVEAITHARKFMSAARAASRLKPVVVIKAGRHAESAKAAHSHTGALAGSDEVYDAAFRRAGMLRVADLDELFDAVETLAAPPPYRGERLAILTNGGGVGVLATDTLIDHGGRLARLSPDTIERLNAALPPTWSKGNPVDIIGDAPGGRYKVALGALLADRAVDAVLVLNCPTAVASSDEAAAAVVETLGDTRQPVFTCWLGAAAAEAARRKFTQHRIPTYETPDKAVRGFMHLVRYRRNQEQLMETPPAAPPDAAVDVAAARAIIAAALGEHRDMLSEPEAKRLLSHYGIPVARTVVARDPEQAASLAFELGGRVALKILSSDITHKSDVGGVVLDLGPGEVRAAAAAMLERVGERKPEARVAGFTVQEMVRRGGAHELILGVGEDRQFGPVLLFGQGGTAVEVVADKALALPPLNLNLAREMMSRTRVYRLLQGYRDRPPAALDAIALSLLRLSQLVCDLDEVVELDINPLLADAKGVVALDARVKVRPARGVSAQARLAIRPYPRELEERVEFAKFGAMRLRPVRPEDEPAFHRAFERLSPEDIRMRFFAPLRRLSHEMAARLTQIDYDREMAFVLETPPADGARAEICGVARLACDPDGKRGEFAVIVRSDLKGHGMGAFLMRKIIDYARSRGVEELFGDVLQENAAMRQLCLDLGFALDELPETSAILRATLKL